MEPILPINGIEEVHPLHAYHTEFRGTPPDVHTAGGSTIDHVRLNQDQDYFLQTLKLLLGDARDAYNSFDYAEAKGIYEQYFRFLAFYRGADNSQYQIYYYPAMFEYSWTLEIQGHREEAEKFFNLQLLQVLNPPTQTAKPQLHPVQETIKTLQQQQVLPSQMNLKVNVPPEALFNLAQQFIAVDNRAVANQIFRLAEVQSLLGLARIGRQIQALQPEEHVQPISSPMLPSPFAHWGIPIAPYMPTPPEARAVIQSKIFKPEYRPDKVDPIQPINKDPRDFDKRWRQQKRNPATAKKSSKVNPKPRSTFPTI